MNILLLSHHHKAIENFAKENNLSEKPVAFVPTAGNVYEQADFVDFSRHALAHAGLETIVVDFSKMTRDELEELFANISALFIGGGNTFYLLQEIKRNDLFDLLKEKIEGGFPYIGASAGAAILAPEIDYLSDFDDISDAPHLTDTNGLDVIDFYPLPHDDQEMSTVYDQLEGTNPDKQFARYNDYQGLAIEARSNYNIVDSLDREPKVLFIGCSADTTHNHQHSRLKTLCQNKEHNIRGKDYLEIAVPGAVLNSESLSLAKDLCIRFGIEDVIVTTHRGCGVIGSLTELINNKDPELLSSGSERLFSLINKHIPNHEDLSKVEEIKLMEISAYSLGKELAKFLSDNGLGNTRVSAYYGPTFEKMPVEVISPQPADVL